MNRSVFGLTVLLLVLLLPAAPLLAGGKDPMNVEDGVLDEIHLKTPVIHRGVPILIHPFTTEGVDLGTGGENAKNEKRSDATKTMVKIAPDLLSEAFKSRIGEAQVFGDLLPPDTAPLPESALVVEGRFTRIDPGSRAKRYWAGFGAGKSGVQVTGTVKDAAGNVLAEFTHMRRSGIGVGGGDYVKFLSDDTRDLGHDIAEFLVRWASGGDLHKD
ncbi:MAG TPA: DUF4410 domain-containing protein [Candidatus Polarisedimenticolia bacterium]|nr:DUF4410 domain-containing protein [Candidatus Polarisedimenticolia bacterium]